MNALIKLYESLLNDKSNLEKECELISLAYIKEFGEEITKLFSLKVEAVTLKKKIAFCISKQYQNKPIYSYELNNYIDEEIASYQLKLNELRDYYASSKEDRDTISYSDLARIKKLYYRIVHLIHPDLHPEYRNEIVIRDLWNKSVDAYKRNDYTTLVEAYDQIMLYVSDNDISIDDIEDKIAKIKDKINDIKNVAPYTYKYILDDNEETKSFHEQLQNEIKDYEQYVKSLNDELSKFEIINNFGDA